jgi:hypothetical protein
LLPPQRFWPRHMPPTLIGHAMPGLAVCKCVQACSGPGKEQVEESWRGQESRTPAGPAAAIGESRCTAVVLSSAQLLTSVFPFRSHQLTCTQEFLYLVQRSICCSHSSDLSSPRARSQAFPHGPSPRDCGSPPLRAIGCPATCRCSAGKSDADAPSRLPNCTKAAPSPFISPPSGHRRQQNPSEP